MYRTLGGASVATCAEHPSFPSVAECSRCHAHLCAHCHVYMELQPRCTTCAKSERVQSGRARTRSRKVVAWTLSSLVVVLLAFVVKWRVDPHGWGKHRHAINALVDMLHKKPCEPSNVRWLVWELNAAHDLRSAGHYLDEVVSVCKLPSDVHKIAYDVHRATGDLDGAVRDASRRILMDGSDAAAFVDRAEAYEALGKLDYAIKDEARAYQLMTVLDPVRGRLIRLNDHSGPSL